MSIDGRLRYQERINQYGKIVYIHKESRNNYSVGIKGTNLRKYNVTKTEAEIEVGILMFCKN